MDLPQLNVSRERSVKLNFDEEEKFSERITKKITQEYSNEASVSLEAEIPEPLYRGMKKFITKNPQWDQYSLMSSALANFLFQNGCENRAVTEKYLNDLFTLVDS